MNRPPLSGPELTAAMKIGTRVVRGVDWNDNDTSDGNPPGEGTVTRLYGDGWLRIRWDTGKSNLYRMGFDGRYELKLAPLPVQQPVSVEQNDQSLISHETQTADAMAAIQRLRYEIAEIQRERCEIARQIQIIARSRDLLVAPMSCETLSAVKGESLAHQNKKNQRFISRETQTEDLTNAVVKGENLAHQNKKGEAIARKHLMDLLLNSKDHDITLTVKDKQFKAHKSILRVRSPVFAAMFAHNMTENESGEVSIEDCDPNAFGEFLKYVYIGKFESMSPVIATGLYYIADKYDFPELKETCVEFLKSSLTTNVLAEVIPLAMKHSEDELLGCALQFFSEHIMDTLKTVEWQRFITNSPILGNEITIKAMEISHKNPE